MEFVCPGFVHNPTCGYVHADRHREFAETDEAGEQEAILYGSHAAKRNNITQSAVRAKLPEYNRGNQEKVAAEYCT